MKRLRRTAERFARAREGATAVEFAMLAGPFLLMLFAVLELALVFMVSMLLENATVAAARKVRTGELQKAGTANQATFQADVCGRMMFLSGRCQGAISTDVRVFPQFKSVQFEDPIKDGKMNPGALRFDAGGPGDIVLVRTYYRWKVVTPFLGRALARLDDGTTLVTATVALRNEPFE